MSVRRGSSKRGAQSSKNDAPIDVLSFEDLCKLFQGHILQNEDKSEIMLDDYKKPSIGDLQSARKALDLLQDRVEALKSQLGIDEDDEDLDDDEEIEGEDIEDEDIDDDIEDDEIDEDDDED